MADRAIFNWREGGNYAVDEDGESVVLNDDVVQALRHLNRRPPTALDPQIHEIVNKPLFRIFDQDMTYSQGAFIMGSNAKERHSAISSLTFFAAQQIYERKFRPNNKVLSYICGAYEQRPEMLTNEAILRSLCTQLIEAYSGKLDFRFIRNSTEGGIGPERMKQLLKGETWTGVELTKLFVTLLDQVSTVVRREGRMKVTITIIVDGAHLVDQPEGIILWLRALTSRIGKDIPWRGLPGVPLPFHRGVVVKYIVTSPYDHAPPKDYSVHDVREIQLKTRRPASEPSNADPEDSNESSTSSLSERSNVDVAAPIPRPVSGAFPFPAPSEQGTVGTAEPYDLLTFTAVKGAFEDIFADEADDEATVGDAVAQGKGNSRVN